MDMILAEYREGATSWYGDGVYYEFVDAEQSPNCCEACGWQDHVTLRGHVGPAIVEVTRPRNSH